MNTLRRYTAVIADDHAIVRGGIKQAIATPGVIEPDGIEVLAEAENGLEAIAATRKHKPDLLFLDVQMPFAGGLEVVLEIRRWCPQTRIVVLTGVTGRGLLRDLQKARVQGLFSKGDDNSELFARLPGILRGQSFVAASLQDLLDRDDEDAELTARESQILNLILRGQSNRDMAETLGISPKTVDRHRTSMMQKLGVRSVPQLVAHALKEGLIDPNTAI